MEKIKFVNVLGIPIARVRLREISDIIADLIRKPGKKLFFYVNAHCLNISKIDPDYKRILNKATFVYADGTGPILASRIFGNNLPERTPALDFIDEVFAIGEENGWKFYFLGGEEKVIVATVEQLQRKFPKLKIAGYHHGFFTKDSVVVEKINRVKPDIVLVGMGAPRQEKWIAENMDEINARVFWAVGGLFDFLSGKIKRAPKWMQRLGFEWAFRFLQEPGRLWKRYLFGNIVFLLNVFQEKESFSHKTSR